MEEESIAEDHHQIAEESAEEPEKDLSVENEEEVDPRDLLSKDQLQYFRDIFDSFDINKKDKIKAKTIGIVLRLMGLNPTKAEIKAHIKEIDPLNKGLIDFQSFLLPIAQRINQEPETHEDVIAAFRILDEEGQDFIYTDQLTEYMTTFGEDLEDFEIELLLKMADSKGSGKVNYVEFVEKMMGIVRKNPKDKKKEGKKKKKK